MRRVLKWTVAVDDRDHPIGSGPVALVDLQPGPGHAVTVWTVEDETTLTQAGRRARVYGTGHPVPEGDVHLGSVQTFVHGQPLVWHLFAGPVQHPTTTPLQVAPPTGLNLQCPKCGTPVEALERTDHPRNPITVHPCGCQMDVSAFADT